MWVSIFQVLLLIIIVLTFLVSLMAEENKKTAEHALALFITSVSGFILLQMAL